MADRVRVRRSVLPRGGGAAFGPNWLSGSFLAFCALLTAVGLVFAHYGGGTWMLMALMAVMVSVALSAWLYLRRQFMAMATFFLTLAMPVIIDVQVWEPGFEPILPSGMPPGLTIFLKDVFLFIVGAVWLLEIVTGERVRSHRVGWASIWIGLFMAFALMFPIHTVDANRSFILWTNLLRGFLVFLFLAKRVDDKDLLRWIVFGIVAQVWVQSLVAYAEYAMGGSLGLTFLGERGVKELDLPTGALLRTGALLGHPNSLALYMVMAGPVILALALRPQRLLPAVGYWTTYILANVTLLLTFSRAGWILAATGFLLVFHLVQRYYGRPLVISLALPVFALVFGFFLLFYAVQPFRDRLLMPDAGSAESRWQQFRTALNIIKHWPIAGTGLGNYIRGALLYNAGEGGINNLFFRVHNGSLLMTVETGVLGGLAYHGWWFCLLRRGWGAWKLRDEYLALVGIGVFAGLVAWLAKSEYNVHTPINEPYVLVHAGLMYAVFNCAARRAALTSDESRAARPVGS